MLLLLLPLHLDHLPETFRLGRVFLLLTHHFLHRFLQPLHHLLHAVVLGVRRVLIRFQLPQLLEHLH